MPGCLHSRRSLQILTFRPSAFPRINLPSDKRRLSRKSLSVYLYSKSRPEHEIVPEHGTFYVQRPLPSHIRPGHVITTADIEQIKTLLGQRDGWIEHYQGVELRVSAQAGEFQRRIRELEDRCVMNWAV
jgi:hypothetical protein